MMTDRIQSCADRTTFLLPEQVLLTLGDQPEQPLVERVLQAFEAHARGEEESIAQYRVMTQSSDPVIALLMQLVVEDEEHHHALLERMAAQVRDDVQWSHSRDALPSPATEGSRDAQVSASAAHALAQEEKDGAHEFRHLAREIGSLHDGLLALLLEMMAPDSEKHALVLRYIEQRQR